MKAAVYEKFRGPVTIENVPDPEPDDHGVILEVKATGVCRSDWHGWMGHDQDIHLPHVPGHEIAGVVAEKGRLVRYWQIGDRVTVPFVCGCGTCPQCATGNHQVCDRQHQPGFTDWGSYAGYVAIHFADENLVALPGDMEFVTAASLGCRFATSFRAVVAQGQVAPGQWVAVHGCGGVGLSAVMIAAAVGARVVAIDVCAEALTMAKSIGAAHTVSAGNADTVVESIKSITGGGAQLSLDALGHRETLHNSIACLRKRGRHVQVGLLAGENHQPRVPMELVIAKELELVGSHGMQAHQYPAMMDLIEIRKLCPERLVGKRIDLQQAAATLGRPVEAKTAGVTVIDRF